MPERLKEPKGPFQEALRDLAKAAMSVTHHDIGEDEPEAIHEIRSMETRFRPILRRLAAQQARNRGGSNA